MSVDFVSTSLTIHGAICAASLLGIWKLGGESKFGTEKIGDLHLLRPKLLKATVASLEATLKPILPRSISPRIQIVADALGGVAAERDELFKIDGEALTNAFRDFIQLEAQPVVDLCRASILDERLTKSVNWLRTCVWLVFSSTGLFCLALGVAKFGWIDLSSSSIHALAFSGVASLLIAGALLLFRILNASGSVDELKSRYVDL